VIHNLKFEVETELCCLAAEELRAAIVGDREPSYPVGETVIIAQHTLFWG
jgi:hypothetical protein